LRREEYTSRFFSTSKDGQKGKSLNDSPFVVYLAVHYYKGMPVGVALGSGFGDSSGAGFGFSFFFDGLGDSPGDSLGSAVGAGVTSCSADVVRGETAPIIPVNKYKVTANTKNVLLII
jgi:hypothetical protein